MALMKSITLFFYQMSMALCVGVFTADFIPDKEVGIN